MPINPDFRTRFVRKNGKTVFPVWQNCGASKALTGMIGVPTEQAWSRLGYQKKALGLLIWKIWVYFVYDHLGEVQLPKTPRSGT